MTFDWDRDRLHVLQPGMAVCRYAIETGVGRYREMSAGADPTSLTVGVLDYSQVLRDVADSNGIPHLEVLKVVGFPVGSWLLSGHFGVVWSCP